MKVESNVTIDLVQSAPSVEDYLALRKLVGWTVVDKPLAQQALSQSLFHVTAVSEGRTIGMARIVGDGALFFYIQDLVVHPEVQQQGIGKLLMNEVERFIQSNARLGATVGLFSAQGKEAFYQSFDYTKRDGHSLGLGMCKFL